ncbi:hypothetical protein BD310DRAFT_886580 [Dichomitus squalens]|uniref:Uncharacterized protein n=1 Tax=Dichomitus squalens TaxID=114155 RepID=A0A4Q9PJC6_9APHY|nr:hypothetical protein BD310DRAFT_886580 [Dichomitus squalens]
MCSAGSDPSLTQVRPQGSDLGSSQGDINVGASGHVNRRVGRPSATRCSLLELRLAFTGHEPAF